MNRTKKKIIKCRLYPKRANKLSGNFGNRLNLGHQQCKTMARGLDEEPRSVIWFR